MSIHDHLDPERRSPTRIKPSDGIPSNWSGWTKILRSRLPDGVRAFIHSANRPDAMRVVIDNASLRRVTPDNAQAVESLIAKFGQDLSKLLGVTSLEQQLQLIADIEDGEKEIGGLFGTKPVRWWEPQAHWRCEKDHVSTCLLGTENGEVCPACGGPAWLAFPEDRDGPLYEALATAGFVHAACIGQSHCSHIGSDGFDRCNRTLPALALP